MGGEENERTEEECEDRGKAEGNERTETKDRQKEGGTTDGVKTEGQGKEDRQEREG